MSNLAHQPKYREDKPEVIVRRSPTHVSVRAAQAEAEGIFYPVLDTDERLEFVYSHTVHKQKPDYTVVLKIDHVGLAWGVSCSCASYQQEPCTDCKHLYAIKQRVNAERERLGLVKRTLAVPGAGRVLSMKILEIEW